MRKVNLFLLIAFILMVAISLIANNITLALFFLLFFVVPLFDKLFKVRVKMKK